jgi:hypothetical protein
VPKIRVTDSFVTKTSRRVTCWRALNRESVAKAMTSYHTLRQVVTSGSREPACLSAALPRFRSTSLRMMTRVVGSACFAGVPVNLLIDLRLRATSLSSDGESKALHLLDGLDRRHCHVR